jgi:ribosomal protein S18 acetylase RimI-like enzyme
MPVIDPVERFHLVERPPTVAEYQRVRAAVGWQPFGNEEAEVGLARSLYSVCALVGDRFAGCGRVVGDAGVYFYIQDLAVLPEYRGQGIGRAMMDALMAHVGREARPGSFIGLMAAKGYAGFYKPYGFVERPADAPGMSMRWRPRE